MKRTRYRLELHNPCAENWNAMYPTAQGRFCQHCAKNVVDFTGLTDNQILAVLKSKGTLCGRVEETQLDRDLVSRTESTFSARLFKVFAGLFLLASTKTAAQELIVKQPRALVTATTQEIFEAKKRIDPDNALQTWVKGRVISAFFKILMPDSLVGKAVQFHTLHPNYGRLRLTVGSDLKNCILRILQFSSFPFFIHYD